MRTVFFWTFASGASRYRAHACEDRWQTKAGSGCSEPTVRLEPVWDRPEVRRLRAGSPAAGLGWQTKVGPGCLFLVDREGVKLPRWTLKSLPLSPALSFALFSLAGVLRCSVDQESRRLPGVLRFVFGFVNACERALSACSCFHRPPLPYLFVTRAPCDLLCCLRPGHYHPRSLTSSRPAPLGAEP